MLERLAASKKLRRNFGKIKQIVDIPDLIGMQHESYQRFLQMDVSANEREDIGLQAVFKSVFPIKDFTGSASLEFVSYGFGEVKHREEECVYRGMTYELPVRITARLVVYDLDRETGISNIRDIKEQEIYFGAIPLMTSEGTFIINGTERVVVSQLHRSSGVFFDHDKGKTHSSGKIVYNSRIIPVRGSWIDMEIDPGKDIVFIRIDRRRKFPVTVLFKAFGYSTEDILNYFYDLRHISLREDGFFAEYNPSLFRGRRATKDIVNPISGDILVKAGRIFTQKALKLMTAADFKFVAIHADEVLGKVFANPINHPVTGELLAEANDVLDDELLERLVASEISEFSLLDVNESSNSDSIRKTLLVDKVDTREDALIEIYRLLRPGNPATSDVAQDFLDNLFFRCSYYDLSGVGRLKINLRLGINTSVSVGTLRKEDILLTAKTLVVLRDTQGVVDDIDHLGNRRIRAVGELLENQYRIGLVRMERAIKERMSLQEIDALMPNDLINSKPVSAVVKEFFGTSQLSQFMDKTNPLSETTHKRRLSALGPGGLTRERAGFEVRDVHPSHYGRICPIETPEGPNIGLIVSLGTYARVNRFGFIETPYRVVEEGVVTDKVKFLSAFEEKDHPIAQVSEVVDDFSGGYVEPTVKSRVAGEFMMVDRDRIELMDVSSNQLVSVSASLIPFLENDDANRALMGSNMQRQAVPLVIAESPLVGTGMEGIVARDSGVTIVADYDGKVVQADSSRIVMKHEVPNERGGQVTIYSLSKFVRSNQSTCFNQRPIVKIGQNIKLGEVIADGPSTDCGELALGKNVMVAFMPWRGYNFEDSILVSERLVRDGVYTSVHIEEFELVARDTKLGKEEVTRDIPNVGEEALKNLDDSGIIRLGAEVKPGDILVGKITPKGETQLSPEEKLLRAIFGEKAGDVKDSSLRVPPGIDGIVVDAKVFSRRGVKKDSRTLSIERNEIAAFRLDRDDELRIIEEILKCKLESLLCGESCSISIEDHGNILLLAGQPIVENSLLEIPVDKLENLVFEDHDLNGKVHFLLDIFADQKRKCIDKFEKYISRFDEGDDLPAGVIKLVKVYVAMKRKLSVGDKMAGRHGNKGVVSRVLPIEDMPYFKDGRPVDMVLNPLGVPSRMNVGQILEIHLGRAAMGLGEQLSSLIDSNSIEALRDKLSRIFDDLDHDFSDMSDSEISEFASLYRRGVNMATPVFDGANEKEIKKLLKEAGLDSSGQTTLYDGHTGEAFREKITVGAMYMLKLHHLVDDKIHARSIGPYSLVTQQPLGGKAQFGGQRLGEMEVWAIEAYGAAFALQEFLTVKSDDMAGRTRMYEKIVKGQNVLEPGIPESFKVMTKELQSLGLNVNLLED